MKTILFYNLASADSDRKGLPFIQAARELGLKVIVATHSNNTKMLCGDINEVVPLEKIHRLRELIIEHKVDLTMTVNSRLTPIVAQLNKNCPISNFSEVAALTLNHKDRCANFIENSDLKAPRHWVIKSDSDWLQIPAGLPVILKPSFSTGAIDTRRFNSSDELRKTLLSGIWSDSLGKQLSLSDFYMINQKTEYFGHFLVQEYIPYQKQIGMELLVVNGELKLVHSAEILTASPTLVSAYAHIGPVDIPQKILEDFQKVITLLQIKNCHLTPDFLVDQQGQWFLIDVNLNPGGEGLLNAIQARGLNYPSESLKAFLGLAYNLTTSSLYSASFAKPTFNLNTEFQLKTALTFAELYELIAEC